ncbi:MAG: hypothetical protein ACJ8FT_06225 [Sphingomonas sp.]
MKHQSISDRAKVWTVTRGPDGRLEEQLEPQHLTSLGFPCIASEIADEIVTEAGERHIAATRFW